MFLLDTDHVGIIQGQTEPEFGRLRNRISRHPPDAFYISIISFHEQVIGWNAYLNRASSATGVIRAYHMFERILADFTTARILSYDQVAADMFDLLRAQRVRVATMDLRIAAAALSRDLTLLSRNLSDFRKVPGLKVEDWTS
jgi:tRNA(fMet)-specific endonuclease VapC